MDEGEKMKTLRAFEIVDYLKERRHCSVEELMRRFDVSPATIHRDIAELTGKGFIQRVHGGVAIAQAAQPFAENAAAGFHFSARVNKESARKAAIAELAARLLEDGDIAFLDSSTTALHLARRIQSLALSNLTLITNSVHIIQEFSLFPQRFVLVGLGGNYNYQLNSLLGKSAVESLKKLRVDRAFVSAVGASSDGVFTYHEDHAEFLRQALSMAKSKHLLIDRSKFGKAGLFKFADLRDFDAAVSDAPLPGGMAKLCRKTICGERTD